MRARILLVEDNAMNRELAQDLLEAHGHEVVAAESAATAIAAAESGDYDLVLLDISLPDRDGLSTVGDLRRLQGTLPIVALTAHALDDDRRRALAAGCDDLITKPIDVARFPAQIDALLGKGG